LNSAIRKSISSSAEQLKRSYALKIKTALRCFERVIPTLIAKQRSAFK
jgi:hypothetical protein